MIPAKTSFPLINQIFPIKQIDDITHALAEKDPQSHKIAEANTIHPRDSVYKHLVSNNYIDSAGHWIDINKTQIPSLGSNQVLRCIQLLNTQYSIKSPLNPTDTVRVSLKELIVSLGYMEFELIGGGAAWLLGKEFFEQFLNNIGFPLQLASQLFADLNTPPQDFDFRFSSPTIDNRQINTLTWGLFTKLADLFKVPTPPLIKHHKKKWFTKKQHADKYAMATLELFHIDEQGGETKAFDVDFIFAKFLKRPYLSKRDAIKVKLKVVKTDSGDVICMDAVTSDLYDVREAIAQYITGRLSSDSSDTINDEGKGTLLATTTKGRIPLRNDFFPQLYNEWHLNARPFLNHLHKVINTHCGGDPLAFLATAFNAFTFFGKDLSEAILMEIDKRAPLHEESILETTFQKTKDSGGLQLIHDLMVAHAYVGGTKAFKVFKREYDSLIELVYLSDRSISAISFFVKDDLQGALSRLVLTNSWEEISTLSTVWLANAALNSLPFPHICEEYIHSLFEVNNTAAQHLSFFLQLQWQKQYPTIGCIHTLFERMYTLLHRCHFDDLSHHLQHLADALEAASTWYPLRIIFSLQEKVVSLRSPAELAITLYTTGVPDLCWLSLKILLRGNPSVENQELALSLFEKSIQTAPTETLSLFLANRLSFSDPERPFLLCLALLEHASSYPILQVELDTAESYLFEAASTHQQLLQNKYFLKVKDTSDTIKQKNGLTVLALLKSLYTKKNKQTEKPSWFYSEQLKCLKKTLQSSADFHKCKELFTQCLTQQYWRDPANKERLFTILDALFVRFGQSCDPANSIFFHWLTDPKIISLHQDNPERLLSYYSSAPINLPQTHSLMPICLSLGSLLGSIKELSQTGLTAAHRFVKMLTLLTGLKHMQSPEVKKTLAHAFNTMIPLLADRNDFLILNDLMRLAALMNLKLEMNEPIAIKISSHMIDNLQPEDLQSLILAEQTYGIIEKSLSTHLTPNKETIKAFVRGYLSFDTPQRALQWIKKTSTSNDLATPVATKLIGKGCWNEVETLLAHADGALFKGNSQFMQWFQFAKALRTVDPTRAASIYLKYKNRLSESLDKETLLDEIKALACELCTNPHLHLTLKLISAYGLCFDPLWDQALKKQALSRRKQDVVEAWELSKLHNYEGSSLSTRIALLTKLQQLQHTDPSLIKYITLDRTTPTPFNQGNEADVQKAAELLFVNALHNLHSPEAEHLDFLKMNAYRELFTLNWSLEGLFDAWANYSTEKQAHSCFLYLKNNEITTFSLNFIPWLYKTISEQIVHKNEFHLHIYSLEILKEKEFPQTIGKKKYEEIVLKLIRKTLEKAKEATDINLLEAILVNCIAYRPLLWTSLQEADSPYIQILELLPYFLYDDDNTARLNMFRQLDEILVEELLSSYLQTKTTKRTQARLDAEWNLRVAYVKRLLLVDSCFPVTSQVALDTLVKHLTTLINTCTTNNRIKCMDILFEFVFSSHFDGEIAPVHIESALALVHLTEQTLPDNDFIALINGFKAYLQLQIPDNQIFLNNDTYNTIVTKTLNVMINKQTEFTLIRGFQLFRNTKDKLRITSESVINCLCALLETPIITPRLAIEKVDWMTKTVFSSLNDITKISVSNTKTKKNIVKLFSTYVNALFKARCYLENNAHPINNNILLSIRMVILLICTRNIIDLDTNEFDQILYLFFRITADYKKQNPADNSIDIPTKNLMRQISNKNKNTLKKLKTHIAPLSLPFDQVLDSLFFNN